MRKSLIMTLVVFLLMGVMGVSAFASELNVIHAGDSNEDFQQLYKQFTEETGIKLNVNDIPHREMLQALEVQMRGGGSGIDVIHVDSPLTASYALRGYLLPLDPYFDVENVGWTSAGIDAGTWDGKLYSAPFETSTQVLFYNKALFEKAGIEPPSMDVNERWTWEQVVDAAKKIKETTGKWGFVFEQVNRPYQLLPLPESLGGGSGVSPDGLEVDGYLNNEGWLEACTFYYNLFNTWQISPKGITSDQTWDSFAAGNIAMIVAGTWQIPAAEKAAETSGLDFGLAPHPYFEGGEVVTPTGSWHWGVNKNSKKIDEAIKFIEFMTARKEIVEWRFKRIGQLVPHEVMFEVIEEDPQYDVFPRNIYHVASYELDNTARVRPVTPAFLEWEDITIKMFEDIRNGADPKTSLDTAVRRLRPLMARYK